MKNRRIYQHIGLMLFITLLLFQAFHKSFILADYYIETQKYIAHCVNKRMPNMHCNGKCQMMKDMEATDQHNPKNSNKENHSSFEINLFYTENIPLAFTNLLNQNKMNFPKAVCLKTIDKIYILFKPPQIDKLA